LSLAAAKATLTKLRTRPWLKTIAARGRKLMAGTNSLINKHQLSDMLSISGHPSWTFLNFKEAAAARFGRSNALPAGDVCARILILSTHNLTLAHKDRDLRRLFAVYDDVFPMLREAVDKNDIEPRLKCKVLEPLFKIR